jgi:predicted transcriptional regulator
LLCSTAIPHEILILKTLAGNQYAADEIIRKSGITKTLVYDRLKRLQDMGLVVKSTRNYEMGPLGFDFLELV